MQRKNFRYMNKIFAFVFTLVCLCAVFTLTSFGGEITDAKTVTSSGNADKLTDSNYKTKIKFDGGGTVRIDSKNEKISHVYVIWDNPPGAWYLNEELISYTHGKNGFIHEFITLNTPCDYVTVNVPSGKTLCDVRVFSAGEIPNDVQIWNPPHERADLLMLPCHSDDDHLYFGGTMPYYGGELGMRVQVAYITNHWGEPVRTHELLNGMWTVGITAYPVISEFPDKPTFSLETAQDIYDSDEVRGYIVELIRRFKPYVLLGHDLLGEYGHGAHMLSALLITEAVEISMNGDAYPESAKKYGLWDVPKTYLHNYEENQIRMDWDIPLERFGGKTGFQMAEAGFDCHKSQHIYDLTVHRNGRCSCRFFGLYRTTVGVDEIKKDFFENIVFEDETPPETEPETTAAPETVPETIPIDTEAHVTENEETKEYVTQFSGEEDDEERKQRITSEIICFTIFGVLIFVTIVIAVGRYRKNR